MGGWLASLALDQAGWPVAVCVIAANCSGHSSHSAHLVFIYMASSYAAYNHPEALSASGKPNLSGL